jgi:hypothetical protein
LFLNLYSLTMKKITIYIIVCFGIAFFIYGYSKADSVTGNHNSKNDTLTALQILTDSSVKYAFGYRCSVAGMPPKGRQAIDKLVVSGDFETIKIVLDGQNNVGKIYAIEALLTAASSKIDILNESDEAKIKKIIHQDYTIARCEGCDFFSIKTIELFNEKEYLKLLTKNGIQIKNRQ